MSPKMIQLSVIPDLCRSHYTEHWSVDTRVTQRIVEVLISHSLKLPASTEYDYRKKGSCKGLTENYICLKESY